METKKRKIKRYFDKEKVVEKKNYKKIDKKQKVNFKKNKLNNIKKDKTDERLKSFQIIKNKQNNAPKFKGPAPINPSILERYDKGTGVDDEGVKTKFFKEKLKRKEVYIKFAEEQTARAEILLNEAEGFMISEEGESTANYTQDEIVKNVDITAGTKHFNINLEFGPYRMRYTRNGRHLLLGGRKGHVAAFDWIRKQLHCEINVMEEVSDVTWLHIETMFAVAQKNWVHIYDNQGIELHCLKFMNKVNRLEFLPYHFLLASANDEGYLVWLDVSIGQMVRSYNSNLGRINIMAQNPSNGVLSIGSSKGIVSMWAPSVREPLAKLLCHSTPLTSVTIDPKGIYMATSGLDRRVKIWDIRELSGPLAELKLRTASTELEFSQKGVLAIASGNVCEIYNKPLDSTILSPYLRQRCNGHISGIRFCPYEDILGVSTENGFSSLLVPGSGEANYDARESNPFQTKSQRKEYEIHALLEKIPSEFISLDTNKLAEVDLPTLKDKIEAKKMLVHLKPPNINFEPRKKTNKKGGSVQMTRNKKIVQEEAKRAFWKETKDIRKNIKSEMTTQDEEIILLNQKKSESVLDRFRPRMKK